MSCSVSAWARLSEKARYEKVRAPSSATTTPATTTPRLSSRSRRGVSLVLTAGTRPVGLAVARPGRVGVVTGGAVAGAVVVAGAATGGAATPVAPRWWLAWLTAVLLGSRNDPRLVPRCPPHPWVMGWPADLGCQVAAHPQQPPRQSPPGSAFVTVRRSAGRRREAAMHACQSPPPTYCVQIGRCRKWDHAV